MESIMLSLDTVKENFCLISGLGAEEAAEYDYLCSFAASEMERRLDDGADAEANAGALCAAAGALAFYNMVLADIAQSNNVSFKAGDVTVTQPDSTERLAAAAAVKEAYMRPVEGLLRSGDIAIVCVPKGCGDAL